jgi:hypothetical protein
MVGDFIVIPPVCGAVAVRIALTFAVGVGAGVLQATTKIESRRRIAIIFIIALVERDLSGLADLTGLRVLYWTVLL